MITPYRDGDDPYAAGQHRGIDIAAATGTPVVAASAGEVRFAGTAGSSGLTVSIRTADGLFDTSYLQSPLHRGPQGRPGVDRRPGRGGGDDGQAVRGRTAPPLRRARRRYRSRLPRPAGLPPTAAGPGTAAATGPGPRARTRAELSSERPGTRAGSHDPTHGTRSHVRHRARMDADPAPGPTGALARGSPAPSGAPAPRGELAPRLAPLPAHAPSRPPAPHRAPTSLAAPEHARHLHPAPHGAPGRGLALKRAHAPAAQRAPAAGPRAETDPSTSAPGPDLGYALACVGLLLGAGVDVDRCRGFAGRPPRPSPCAPDRSSG